MSYLECPDCGKEIDIFGKSKLEKSVKEAGLDLSLKLPLRANFAKYCDEGGLFNLLNKTFSKGEALSMSSLNHSTLNFNNNVTIDRVN